MHERSSSELPSVTSPERNSCGHNLRFMSSDKAQVLMDCDANFRVAIRRILPEVGVNPIPKATTTVGVEDAGGTIGNSAAKRMSLCRG